VIVVYAGVQPDQAGRVPPRLPPDAVPDVAARVQRLLAGLRPRLVVGAAAAGADLIVIQAAMRAGVVAHVVLPFDVETFAQTSVNSAGGSWPGDYRRLVADSADSARVQVETLSADRNDDRVYHQHNSAMLAAAQALATADERVWALVIRPAPDPDRPSVTDDFAAQAEESEVLVLDLDPTKAAGQRKSAFIAMPYGQKFDPVTRLTVNCDDMFNRVYVPVLEDLDLEWKRADLETDSGIIHVGMIDELARCDLVVADLATGNANVSYEIGLRHAFAPSTTVLVRPLLVDSVVSQQAPFDLAPLRAAVVNRSVAMTEAEAEAAVKAVRQLVAGALAHREPDSPVYTLFDRTDRGGLRRKGVPDPAVESELAVRAMAERAVRSESHDELLQAAAKVNAEVIAAGITAAAGAGLSLQLGAALLAGGYDTDAVTVLGQVEPTDTSPIALRWLQQLALAHRRVGEDLANNGRDPDHDWAEAERLLSRALKLYGPSAETSGIAGGLAKRRALHALHHGNRAMAGGQLARMTNLYRSGHLAEPSYYAGVNLVAALRLTAQRFAGPASLAAEAAEAIAVTRFLARRAADLEPNAFWATVTLAELDLHEALYHDPVQPDLSVAQASYAAAGALPASADNFRAARDQLTFLVACGDPPQIKEILAAVLPG